MNVRSVLALSLALGAGLACSGASFQGVPVPAAQQDLVGVWTNPGLKLEVTPDGFVHYEKHRAGTVEINGPVTAWTQDGFSVGAFGVNFSNFHVEVPPHQNGGQWECTIDGEVLTRP